MELTLETGDGAYTVRSYEPGKIQVNDQYYTSSIILSPHQLEENWPPQRFEALEQSHLMQLAETKPDIILLGTGETHAFLPPALLASVKTGIEVMTTAAACRTYNLLMSESRQVVAGLIVR